MRPTPERFLQLIQAESSQKKGKLKIFFGYASGVGKTYAMLEDIALQKQQGVDAIIGYAETHGRPETERLLEGLEIIHRKMIPYKGITLQEMDLDAVLNRHPALVAVDELAHTNAPSSRHLKRYQDVQEMLDAGIDVYTTLNIQHLESLNDLIAKITGIKMKETLPDSILQEADEIKVVDITIDELLQRLKEGKVYIPERARQAIQNFFNEGTLTALRELTLRRAAKRVTAQMQSYIQREAITGPWPSIERLLVCVTPYPSSMELVRAGSLLAIGLDAQWSVIHVESSIPISIEDKEQLQKTLKLAEDLGARIVQLTGENIPHEVISYAIEQNVTKIIVGKPLKRRWRDFFKGSLVDEIIRNSGNIDVQVINRDPTQKYKKIPSGIKTTSPWYYYLYSFVLVSVISIIGEVGWFSLSSINLLMLYGLVVVLSAIWWGRGPSIFSAIVSIITLDTFLMSNASFSLEAIGKEYFLAFVMLLGLGFIISFLKEQVKLQNISVRERERRVSVLYRLCLDLTSAVNTKDVLDAATKHIDQYFESQTVILLPNENGLVKAFIDADFPWDESEKAVADWVFLNQKEAGRTTGTLPGANALYRPLKTNGNVVGVLGIYFKNTKAFLTLEDRNLLDAFITQIAATLERVW